MEFPSPRHETLNMSTKSLSMGFSSSIGFMSTTKYLYCGSEETLLLCVAFIGTMEKKSVDRSSSMRSPRFAALYDTRQYGPPSRDISNSKLTSLNRTETSDVSSSDPSGEKLAAATCSRPSRFDEYDGSPNTVNVVLVPVTTLQ